MLVAGLFILSGLSGYPFRAVRVPEGNRTVTLPFFFDSDVKTDLKQFVCYMDIIQGGIVHHRQLNDGTLLNGTKDKNLAVFVVTRSTDNAGVLFHCIAGLDNSAVYVLYDDAGEPH